MAFFPVIICALVLYLLVRNYAFVFQWMHELHVMCSLVDSTCACWLYSCSIHTFHAVGGYTSLGPAGVPPGCLGKYFPQPSLDSSADMAHSNIPAKSISSLSCYISSGRIHQWLLYTHPTNSMVVSVQEGSLFTYLLLLCMLLDPPPSEMAAALSLIVAFDIVSSAGFLLLAILFYSQGYLNWTNPWLCS